MLRFHLIIGFFWQKKNIESQYSAYADDELIILIVLLTMFLIKILHWMIGEKKMILHKYIKYHHIAVINEYGKNGEYVSKSHWWTKPRDGNTSKVYLVRLFTRSKVLYNFHSHFVEKNIDYTSPSVRAAVPCVSALGST